MRDAAIEIAFGARIAAGKSPLGDVERIADPDEDLASGDEGA